MENQGIRIESKKDHLVIRSATIEDAGILTNWWNDGKVMAHAGFPNGLGQTIHETRKQIEDQSEKLSQLCIIEENQIRIGEMSYHIGEGFAEIGIKICETTYQNQGIGTKVLQMLIDFLFNDKKINQQVYIQKIILDTNLKNIRAQHVYEKIGFQKISVHHDAWKDQLGILQSSVDYELTRTEYEDGVRYIVDSDLKEQIAECILSDLPDWFGLPDSTREYIEKSRDLPFFAYYKENRYVGFIVLKETSQYTAELYVMGVLKNYHRHKIGEKLFQRFFTYAKQKKYEFIQVKTVDEGHYEEYDRTRLFYENMGFKKLECFPTLWDEWNPCLVMVMSTNKNEENKESKPC